MTELYQNLPSHDVYRQSWHVSRQNWQPLFWLGYDQRTSYTYRLEDISEPEKIWSDMHQNTRNDIRKARDRNKLTVRAAQSVDEFLQVNNRTFARLTAPYPKALVQRAYDAAKDHDAVDILVVEDLDGNLHAAAMIVKDQTTAYYLMGGADPNFRMSGAQSYLVGCNRAPVRAGQCI